MDYRNWGDGERAESTYPYADPRSQDDPHDPGGFTGFARRGGGFRVPGQRQYRSDEPLARPYIPGSDAGWSPSGGRHRELPAADGGGRHSASPEPTRWPSDDRWRPTLDPADWRYTTGDLGYSYGYPPWEEDPRRDAEAYAPPGDPGTGPLGRPQLRGGDWAGTADTELWDRPSGDWPPPEQWDNRRSLPRQPQSDTGAWDRVTDTGEWQAGSRSDGFWSGLRLSGDDPRWMATPSSAPRSPAVSLPELTSHDPAAAPPVPSPTLVVSVDGAPVEGGRESLWAALLATVAWYAVPALVLLAWILTLDGSTSPVCAADAGQGCESARAQAIATLLDSGPRIAAALGASAAIALLLRWVSSWRAVAVGLAAAVIGGGVSTLMISLVTGQPLG